MLLRARSSAPARPRANAHCARPVVALSTKPRRHPQTACKAAMPRGSSSGNSGDSAASGGDDQAIQQQPEEQQQQPEDPSTSTGGGGDDGGDDGANNGGRGGGGGGGGGGGDDNNNNDDQSNTDPPPASASAGGVFGAFFGSRSAGGAGGGGAGGGASASSGAPGSSTVALTLRNYGPGHTFVLAGFLKILTIGSVAAGAPAGAYRTAAGEISPYLLVPVSLGLCAAAKFAVDSKLVDEPGFLPGLTACLALIYFGITPLLYRYDGDYSDLRRRVLAPRPRGHGRLRPSGALGEAMVEAGGRDLLATAADSGAGSAWGRRTSRAVGQVHDPDEYYRRGRYVTVEQKRREEMAREEADGGGRGR